MPDHIKLGSDRPDYDQILRDDDGRRVDLTDASAVYLLMWDEAGNLLINDQASMDEAPLGEVAYDLQRGQVISAGINEIEFRVEWNDGDRQWFPTDQPGYELEVVRAAGDRDASLEDTDAQTDAEVNRLLVHDAIDVQDDDGEMEIVNGDVAITGGDLTVSGTVTIGDLVFGDDDPLTYGLDGDYEVAYDSTADHFQIRNAIAALDVLTITKGGDVTAPNGFVSAELLDVTTAGAEQNVRFGSKDSGITTHAFVRALIESDDVTGDSVLVFDDSDAGTGVVRVDLASGDIETDGAVTIGGDTAATQAWVTAQNIAHAELSGIGADDHHAELTIHDSGSEATVGDYVLDFGDALNVSVDSGTVTIDSPFDSRYTDEEAQDAVAAALGNHFTYDDPNDVIQLEPGNIAHDQHSGLTTTNHHAALTVQDSGTEIASDEYTIDFGDNLSASESGGTVTVDASGGGGSATQTVTTSSDYTAGNNENVLADASGQAITVTLPAPSDDLMVNVKSIDAANDVTVATPGSETIDGDANRAISAQYVNLTITSDGTNYFIV